MPTDVRELLERGAPSPLRDVDVAAVSARGRQWRRRRSATAAAAVAAVVALVVLPLPQLLTPATRVVLDQPPTAPAPLVGTWVSTDSDGSSQTMDITAADGGYDIVVKDDSASVCSGAPSTMTGTGRMEEAGLVIAAPALTCDDGSTPVPWDGSSLEEAVRNYTLVHDGETDALTDSLGIPWRRRAATPDAGDTEPAPSRPMWPQSSLKEVREAQERADAGDPAYTWQVEPAMDDVGGDAEIFIRFLTEELAWEEFRWSESIFWDRPDGAASVDFVRCAAGELNSLYPKDPEGRRCAPTVDEYAYETVRLTAYQPLGDGPDDIWVMGSSQPQPPFRQVDPLTDAEIARAVEPFLQARVDGKGASGIAGPVPLLYAGSDGGRYERFDYEVVDGPNWPYGEVSLNVRLFADGGQTVVEQPFSVELDFSSVVTPAPPDRLTMINYDRGERPTTENAAPVPESYDLFGRRVTFSADWFWSDDLIGPHGPESTGLYRGNGNEQLFAVVGEPLTPTGTCDVGDRPPSADALVRSIRSLPNLSVSAPRPARVGPIDAVQLDVTARDQGDGCVVVPGAQEQPDEGPAVLAPRADKNHQELRLWWGVGRNDRARLYVFDVPGKPTRTVAILVKAPKAEFESLLEAAQPILDSFAVEGS